MAFSTDTQAAVLALLPEILMIVLAVVVLAVDVLWTREQRREIGYLAGFGLLAVGALYFVLALPPKTGLSDQLLLGGMIRHDPLAQIFRIMVILAGALTCLISMGLPRLRLRGDYYALVIVAVIGMSLVSASADLVMVFLALETMSITLYLLAGYLRDEDRSTEAGLKYFLFGAFVSAFTVYGLSLLYGLTGATNLYALGTLIAAGGLPDVPVLLAMLLVLAGFAFKISAVPFHFWTPDVYEGAPTPITALLSTGSKAASVALLLRFVLAVFPPAELVAVGDAVRDYSRYWVEVVAVLAVVSMTLGNVLALVQTNLKRLLAYSTIAHAGYVLIGVAAISTDKSGDGAAAVTYYMFMYVFSNMLAFAVLILFANVTGSERISDMAGLSRRNPWLALVMTLALLSLAGIPPAAGFVGKFLLFRAAVNSNLVWLALVGIVNVIIGLYYYLIIVKVMYMHPSPEEEAIPVSVPYTWALAITSAGVLLFGTILVTPLLNWATDAAQALFIALG